MNLSAKRIQSYILAKDRNRPHLMLESFTRNAVLEMIVHTGNISFPPLSEGRDLITDLLVRRFNQTYENIYTFCLANPPQENGAPFSCDWLVGMSEKETGNVRVGCGRYDWVFQSQEPCLVERLSITIDQMLILGREDFNAVMDWVTNLPYPWCPAENAAATAPKIAALEEVIQYIDRGR